ncbi:hypothetical protein H7100_02285 [Candidatus Saccharibacteria bacterium]|nr:hypothetical protein [Candidatus Saccharibacteria bacterium]
MNGIDAQSVDLRMFEPMALSFGTFYTRPSGWLALNVVVDGTPVVGYGEGATLPAPVFTDDSGETIADAMKEIATVIGGSTRTVRESLGVVQSYTFADASYPTARFATEMAILDAATKANNMSVADFIGLPKDISSVPYGKSIGGDSEASIIRQVEQALELHAKKIKLKISPISFHYVIDALQRIKTQYPEVELMVDANGSFDPLSRVDTSMIEFLDELDLIMIEEPVSRVGGTRGIDAARVLREKIPRFKTLICLDDCLASRQDCVDVLEQNIADIINIKPGRIGSFLQSLELVDTAKSLDKQVMVGGMLEASPGRYATTLLGAYCLSRGFTIAGDISLAQERLSEDLVPAEKQLQLTEDGNINLSRQCGWGF